MTVRTGGEEIFNGRIPGQHQALEKLFEGCQGCRMKVEYEAGPFGFWLSDKLIQDGIDVLVKISSTRPRTVYVNAGRRVHGLVDVERCDVKARSCPPIRKTVIAQKTVLPVFHFPRFFTSRAKTYSQGLGELHRDQGPVILRGFLLKTLATRMCPKRIP